MTIQPPPPVSSADPAVKALQAYTQTLYKALTSLSNKVNAALPGAIPGEFIAGRIRGVAQPGNANSMMLNFSGGAAGVSPTLLVSDGTYNRVQIGNLAAYTDPNGVVSPAEDGIRVLNASGDIELDSVGISAVASVLGTHTNLSGASGTGTGSVQSQSGTQVSFSVTRLVNVLIMGYVAASGIAGNPAQMSLGIDGTFALPIAVAGTTVFQTVTLLTVASLASGAHTAQFGVIQTNGDAWAWDFSYLAAIQLGG